MIGVYLRNVFMSQAIVYRKPFFILGFILLSVVTMLLLIGPRVPLNQQKQQCVVDLHIIGPFGLSLNCDSPEFIKDALHPHYLLTKNSVRQSRPGMILAAYILSKPLFFLNYFAKWYHPHVTRDDIAPSRVNALWGGGFAVFGAYLLLNLVILMLACYFYFALVQIRAGISVATLSLIAIFFSNALTQTYLWSPHTQMFNIMEPLFLCWIVYQGMQRSIFDKWWFLMSAVMGLLVTAYGTFLLYAPCLFVIFLYQYIKSTVQPKALSPYVMRLVGHAIVFMIPTVVWYAIVKSVVGSYYVHEAVVYKQFTWMAEAWHQGVATLLSQLLSNTRHTAQLILQQNYILLTVIIILSVVLRKHVVSAWDYTRIVALCTVAFLSAVFVIFNGFVIPRMVSTIIPLCVVGCGYSLECLATRLSYPQQQWLNGVCVAAMVLYSAWALVF